MGDERETERGEGPGVCLHVYACLPLCMPSARSGGRFSVFISNVVVNPLIVLNYLMALIRALDSVR